MKFRLIIYLFLLCVLIIITCSFMYYLIHLFHLFLSFIMILNYTCLRIILIFLFKVHNRLIFGLIKKIPNFLFLLFHSVHFLCFAFLLISIDTFQQVYTLSILLFFLLNHHIIIYSF